MNFEIDFSGTTLLEEYKFVMPASGLIRFSRLLFKFEISNFHLFHLLTANSYPQATTNISTAVENHRLKDRENAKTSIVFFNRFTRIDLCEVHINVTSFDINF